MSFMDDDPLEHFILALLSDERKDKRRLGVKYIFYARENIAPGIRYFIKMDRTNINLHSNDYSTFLDIKSLTTFTEPPVTMHLTEDQLVDILNGFESVLDLCDLRDVHCHTQVTYNMIIFIGYSIVQSNLAIRNCLIRNKLVLRNHFL